MTEEHIIKFENITKKFPGLIALNNVSFTIKRGACHGLIGENGAGKSTLGKILAGIYQNDAGRIYVDGKLVKFKSPRDALNSGIGIVHQELSFCENLTVAENLCLQNLPHRGPFVNSKSRDSYANHLLSSIGTKIDINKKLGDYTISQQQMVQIAIAVGRGARIIIFDEPTSSLSQQESDNLFKLIKNLQSRGVTSIYITHRIKEIFELCNEITILRDGLVVGTKKTDEVDENTLVEMMIGRRLEEYFPKHLSSPLGKEMLKVENLSSPGKFKNISFSLRAGEVLGLCGLVGAGRTEISEAIFGLDKQVVGKIYFEGKQVKINSPKIAVNLGIGLVPEDRKRHGLVLQMSCKDNLVLPILERFSIYGWINNNKVNKVVQNFCNIMKIKARKINDSVESLSGGNQQKIMLARWLAAQCKVLILDEPTRGVDVGTKAEIHSLIDQLAREGTAILLISSELPEIINLSKRIIVLRDGHIVAELPREHATQENLMKFMAGIHNN